MDDNPHGDAGGKARGKHSQRGKSISRNAVESQMQRDKTFARGIRRDVGSIFLPPCTVSGIQEQTIGSGQSARGRGRSRGEFHSRRGRGKVAYPVADNKFGFKRLEGLAKEDGIKIMELLASEELTSQLVDVVTSSMDKPEWLILIVTLVGKLCNVAYDTIVVKLLAQICTNKFLDELMLHIVSIDALIKLTDVGSFLHSLCDLYLGILRRLPTLASERLTKFILQTSRALKEDIPSFDGIQNIDDRLKLIATMLEQLKLERGKAPVNITSVEEASQFKDPPDNFRDLKINPTVDDVMFEGRPFLRPNIPRGPFQNVDHYLDVHFRLMREDFIRPLRMGIRDLLNKLKENQKDGRKRRIKVDNIRFYDRVELREVKQEDQKMGVIVCFDPENRWCSQVNWEFSKRFMFGSLLVFTQNHFADILLGTVASRKDLDKGIVLVEFCEDSHMKNLFSKKFIMVESQVFFEPYAHVLRALQMFDEESFPLVPYIVEGKSVPEPPGYLAGNVTAEYKIFGMKKDVISEEVNVDESDDTSDDESDNTSDDERGILNFHKWAGDSLKFRVLEEAAWPAADELGLDESQYQALIGALTRKVMLIQGPPGTGKTFLGLKVAEILLQNSTYWTTGLENTPILVVCYTNHALDQFLNGIMKFTHKIVRVGGGCKEGKLAEKSLKNLRKYVQGGRNLRSMMFGLKEEFRAVKEELNNVQVALNKLKSCAGIVSPYTLRDSDVMTSHELQSFDMDGSFLLWLLEGTDERKNVFSDTVRSRLAQFHGFFSQQNLESCFLEVPSMAYMFIISFENINRGGNDIFYSCEAGTEYLSHLCILQQQLRNEDSKPQNLNMDRVRRLRSLWTLSFSERRQLYRSWVSKLCSVICEKADALEVKFREVRKRLQEGQMLEDQMVMQNNLVIGMTTTYAASRQLLLKQLKPRIVIIEEAAEVLESHVIVSLAGNCQHLVLIGDHQQLRPNPAVFELATKYHLDLSLFERLLNNGVDCVALHTQHRMRPEVAELICPTVYPHLHNHESVLKYESVKGVAKSVYFIKHMVHEEEVPEIQSFRNTHEASFTVALVRYLLQQGYNSSQITILSTYKGQQFYFSALRKKNACLDSVRITVVDNYQGEENDIILLSLVRSNEEDKVGFLKTENRVCVALSRAKMGLYMIGNMTNLIAKGDIWPKVKCQLEAQHALGEHLTLVCPVHFTELPVKSAEDFEKCPEGGCLELCQVLMPCGHTCESVCHSMDRKHEEKKCIQACNRMCRDGHKCPSLCYEECPPCNVPKTEMLGCGHSAEMPCYSSSDSWKCQVLVKRNLIPCEHESEMKCHQDPAEVHCSVPCRDRLDCGHVCARNCHPLDDPKHAKYQCRKPCQRKNADCQEAHQCRKVCYEECELCTVLIMKTLTCGHEQQLQCHDEPSDVHCSQKCTRVNTCGHKCTKLCKEPCEPCLTKVTKVIPMCQHKETMNCGENESTAICSSKCERSLECGHACTKTCGATCTEECMKFVESSSLSPCGHKVLVPCSKRLSYGEKSLELLALCKQPCGTMLACEHRCKGTCSSCLQGRLHEVCKENCGRILICGHSCNAPCAASCPPCSKMCFVKCEHSVCPRRCGEPCAMCMEKCSRTCIHQRCRGRCSDICRLEPCSQPCNKKLRKCKHSCIGFCGDPCPPLCRICDKEEVTSVFLGHEDEENARFVFLPDCSHVIESQGLEAWLQQSDEIKLKACPKCTKPIMTCKRYVNYVKRHGDDVAKIKRRLYGDPKAIKDTAFEALIIINSVTSETRVNYHYLQDRARSSTETISLPLHPLPNTTKLLNSLKGRIASVVRSVPQKRGRRWQPPVSLVEMQNLLSYCQILKDIDKTMEPLRASSGAGVLHASSGAGVLRASSGAGVLRASSGAGVLRASSGTGVLCASSGAGVKEVACFVEKLSGNIEKRSLTRLSEQEARDLNAELMRLNHLIQVVRIENSPNFKNLPQTSQNEHRDIASVVRGWCPYAKEKSELTNKQLKKLAKELTIMITKDEIRAVVAAMGPKQGHWFNCPNGHPYYIGDCGGATQVSHCNECGSAIGGQNHRLLPSNTLASDIDGATRHAWPGGLY